MTYIVICLCFNILDFVTGIISGFKKDGKLISSKMRDGLFKKIGFICCYVLTYLVSYSAHIIGISENINVMPVIAAYVILTEIISTCENIYILNDKLVPSKIKKLLGVGNERN